MGFIGYPIHPVADLREGSRGSGSPPPTLGHRLIYFLYISFPGVFNGIGFSIGYRYWQYYVDIIPISRTICALSIIWCLYILLCSYNHIDYYVLTVMHVIMVPWSYERVKWFMFIWQLIVDTNTVIYQQSNMENHKRIRTTKYFVVQLNVQKTSVRSEFFIKTYVLFRMLSVSKHI